GRARRIGRRGEACMNTLVNITPASGMPSRDETHTSVNACRPPVPATARLSGHAVGASGVVGFLRVKDEQKCVPIAEASASAGYWHSNQHMGDYVRTRRGQQEDNPDTKRQQTDDRRATNGIHNSRSPG